MILFVRDPTEPFARGAKRIARMSVSHVQPRREIAIDNLRVIRHGAEFLRQLRTRQRRQRPARTHPRQLETNGMSS
jgi:hypothetical protein